MSQHGGSIYKAVDRRDFDKDGKELVLLRDLDGLEPQSRELIRRELRDKVFSPRIQRVLGAQAKNVQVDAQSRAHLEELHDQIERVLKASLQVNEL